MYFSSAIIVDAEKGSILYSYEENKKIYPASLTKIMTSYVVFDAIKNGALGINDIIITKKNGNRYKTTIKDALLKLAVSSSNYDAVLLAKEVSGDINKFIEKMNYFAQKLNMKNTHFNNVNGLPDKNNYSTAKDLAKLSIRLVYDFPQYSQLFGITNYIDSNGKYQTKTSTIQSNLRGIEGGKTGYVDASGYNLCVWGKYNEKRIFVIVIGASNRINRDNLVIKLINYALKNDLNTKIHPNNNLQESLSKVISFIGLDPNNYLYPTPVQRKGFIKTDNIKKEDEDNKYEENKYNQYSNYQPKSGYFYRKKQ